MFSWRHLVSVGIAIVCVVAVASLRLVIESVTPTGHAPFVMFAMAVLVAGIAGGFVGALVATALATLAINFLFLEPLYSLTFEDRTYVFQFALFISEGLIIAILAELYHRNLRAAAAGRADLESRVDQRTSQLATVNQKLMEEVFERTAAEHRLANERTALSALLESLQDGILACDTNGRIVRYNAAVVRMCGITNPADESPESWWRCVRLIDPDTGERLQGDAWPLARVLREGSYDKEELTLITPNGEERQVSISGRTIRDVNGRLTGGVISLHDVTEIIEARERLNELVTELSRSNRELQDFASVASHDLQEPLRKIQAFGDRLKDTQGQLLNEQGRDYLSRMHNAAGRMQVLINDLLAFARITTKAQPFQRVELAEIVREVLGDLETLIANTHASVEVDDLPSLDADPLQLRQLIQNLVGNALKFHKRGQAPIVRIDASIREDEDDEQWVELRVQDNGIGFDLKYLDRIFNIFQRLHGRGEYEGTGVGLAVCRKIVQRHGGDLTADSRPGEGATFIVSLPRYHSEVHASNAT